MAGVAGVELVYALKKATVWNTAVACGALDGFLSKASTIKRTADAKPDDSLGLFFPGDGVPSEIKAEGDLPGYLRFDGFDVHLALALGTAGAPTVHAGGAIAYDYVYKPAKSIDGLFGTFCKNMKNYIAEHPSMKVYGFTIKGQQGAAVELTLHCICNNVLYNIGSGTNTQTTFNNVTIAEPANQVRFAQAVIRMNDQSGGALASPGDVVSPTEFEFVFKRKLRGVYGTYNTGGATPQDIIDEPTNDGVPECTLKLTFPRHIGCARLTDLGNDVRKKCDITFTGPLIEGAINRSFKLQYPHLQMKTVDITDAQGIINEPAEFYCYTAAAAPTGMTGITDAFRVSGTNKRSTDPLA